MRRALTPWRESASATTGPTAATRVRSSAARTRAAGATAKSRSTCGGLGSRVDLAAAPGRGEESCPKLWLVPLDAAEDAAQPLAGRENDVIEGFLREGAGEGEDRRGIRGVADRDQRAAEHPRATPLEHGGEHLELSRLGHRDGATGERRRFHSPAILAEPTCSADTTRACRAHYASEYAQGTPRPPRARRRRACRVRLVYAALGVLGRRARRLRAKALPQGVAVQDLGG